MCSTATGAAETANRLLSLFRSDATKVRTLGRAVASALQVFDTLRQRPLATITDLAERTGTSYPTVARAIAALEKLNIVHEITGRKRERVFVYERYVSMLNEGGEPL